MHRLTIPAAVLEQGWQAGARLPRRLVRKGIPRGCTLVSAEVKQRSLVLLFQEPGNSAPGIRDLVVEVTEEKS